MPVYTSHLLRYEDVKLGERIRQARVARGLKLRDLAARVGISAARLSEIENELHVPMLQQVIAIAEALNVSHEQLLPSDVGVPYQIERERVVRSRPPRTLVPRGADGTEPNRHAQFWPLAELFTGRHLEPVLGRFRRSPLGEPRLWCHHEEEFVFVIKGNVEFRLQTSDGPVRETMRRGDCVSFRSDLPHGFQAVDEDQAETLHVFAAASAPPQNGFDWFSNRQSPFVQDASDGRGSTGERIRAARELHGWTLEEVAGVTGLSVRQLRQIEEAQRGVPVDAVLRLARALGRPLGELIGRAPDQHPPYFVQRSADIATIPSRGRRMPVERPSAPQSKTCQPLASGFPARYMFPYFIRLLNVPQETLTLHEHHGHEFIYVLEGDLELITYAGDHQVTEELHAGDSCYLDSSVPHLVHAQTRNPYSETSAEVIDVFWSPLGEGYLFDR